MLKSSDMDHSEHPARPLLQAGVDLGQRLVPELRVAPDNGLTLRQVGGLTDLELELGLAEVRTWDSSQVTHGREHWASH